MSIVSSLAPLTFFSPFAALFGLSIIGLTRYRSNEILVRRIVMISQVVALLVSALVFIFLIYPGNDNYIPLTLVEWQLFSFGEHGISFKLTMDKLSSCFVLLSIILTNIVGVFSQHYLHRDASFFRFFFLNTLFLNGIIILFTGFNFQVLFIGWEIVGITSALLISFFNLRKEAVDNALNAFWAYRVSDIGLLTGAAILGAHGNLHAFNSSLPSENLPAVVCYIVPIALLLSAMGKSAQYPFSSWLPKAMEGPTSSSAIFYGGLSIHAGVYLLIRLTTEYNVPPIVLYMFIVVGVVSSFYGMLLSQVQSDVKSALAYASLSQVGLMFIELGLGFYKIVIIHAVGHAFLRTYQILKSGAIIHEFLDFEDAHRNESRTKVSSIFSFFISEKSLQKIFSYSFDLALRDTSSPSKIILNLESLSGLFNRLEDAWINFVTGCESTHSKES